MPTSSPAVLIADFIPPSWSTNVKTRKELEADGWFPEEELTP